MRAVADAMLAFGAEQVLIDGAIDRRAASSPDVADGLVIATGAVLGRDIEQVVAETRDAVELVRLPGRTTRPAPAAAAGLGAEASQRRWRSPPRFVLERRARADRRLLSEHPGEHFTSRAR